MVENFYFPQLLGSIASFLLPKSIQRKGKYDGFTIFAGTVEWLPGAPLGNTFESWSDVLLGDVPNLYIYAANNPSETIIR